MAGNFLVKRTVSLPVLAGTRVSGWISEIKWVKLAFCLNCRHWKPTFLPPSIWVHAYWCSLDRYAKKFRSFLKTESSGCFFFFHFCRGQPMFWGSGDGAGRTRRLADSPDKWNSSYLSEENNNPGLDSSSPINDRGNYGGVARQANRITVRFCRWLGCHSPITAVSPDWSSLSPLCSLSAPVLFHLLHCLVLLFPWTCSPG